MRIVLIYVTIPRSLIFLFFGNTKTIYFIFCIIYQNIILRIQVDMILTSLVPYFESLKGENQKLRLLQDFTLDMYFRQFWQDPRLSFERRIGLEKLVVGAEYIKLIWVPDTFFVNEKTAYFHDATTDNQFLRILHTGEILRSIR